MSETYPPQSSTLEFNYEEFINSLVNFVFDCDVRLQSLLNSSNVGSTEDNTRLWARVYQLVNLSFNQYGYRDFIEIMRNSPDLTNEQLTGNNVEYALRGVLASHFAGAIGARAREILNNDHTFVPAAPYKNKYLPKTTDKQIFFGFDNRPEIEIPQNTLFPHDCPVECTTNHYDRIRYFGDPVVDVTPQSITEWAGHMPSVFAPFAVIYGNEHDPIETGILKAFMSKELRVRDSHGNTELEALLSRLPKY